MLREIRASEGKEVTGGGELHNEELHDLYCSGNNRVIIWRMR